MIEITNNIENVPFDHTIFGYRHGFKNVRDICKQRGYINFGFERHVELTYRIVSVYLRNSETSLRSRGVTWHCNEKVYAAARFVTPRATPDRSSCVTPPLCRDFDELFLFLLIFFPWLGKEGKKKPIIPCIARVAFGSKRGEKREEGGRILFGK